MSQRALASVLNGSNRWVTGFASWNPGNHPKYMEDAHRLGTLLGQAHIGLVFGGTKVGVMRALANGALEQGGQVIGIVPAGLWPDYDYSGCTVLEAQGFPQRKAMMLELGEALLVLPGGVGTLDELFDGLVLSQYELKNMHRKPIGMLNTVVAGEEGVYDDFFHSLRTLHQKGFISAEPLERFLIEQEPEVLFERLLVDPLWTRADAITGRLGQRTAPVSPQGAEEEEVYEAFFRCLRALRQKGFITFDQLERFLIEQQPEPLLKRLLADPLWTHIEKMAVGVRGPTS